MRRLICFLLGHNERKIVLKGTLTWCLRCGRPVIAEKEQENSVL